LQSADFRRKLAEGGIQAMEGSTDALIILAREIDPHARALLKRFKNEVQNVDTQAYDVIAGVWKESGGKRRYPDGTFTPRLSFGVVKGYEENGKAIPPFTTLRGLYARAAEHNNEEPFKLPTRWLEKKAALDLDTPFNFVSSNDIIGGNSGSPVINANAEVVGLIFDGNLQSLVGDFYYDETANRAISVDARAIVEALKKVYQANGILRELGVKN
jgi:hypothetical protein